MLIMFGAAVAGVLVEAFAPRRLRYRLQLTLSLGASVAALVAVLVVARGLALPGHITVSGAVAIDGPTLLLQGTLLVVGILAIMLIAERRTAQRRTAERRTSTEEAAALSLAHAGSDARSTENTGFDAFTPQAAAIPGSAA